MKKAIIKLNLDNHESNMKTITFYTVFGDVKISLDKVQFVDDCAIVPYREFTNRGFNPCQVISGFVA